MGRSGGGLTAGSRRWLYILSVFANAELFRRVGATASASARIAAYNRDVALWMEAGGGLTQMETAFPDDTLKIVFSKPGPSVVKPVSVILTANYTTMDLHDENPALKYYNGSLWFEGTLPMWDEMWSNNSNVYFNPGRDQYYTLVPYDVNGMAMQPLTLQSYKCDEFSQEVLCDTLPSPPPPLDWGGHSGRAPQQHGRKLMAATTDTAAGAEPSEQASPSDLVGVGAAPAKSNKGCTGYFRQINFLSTVTLVTSLSGTNSSWTFTTDTCSMEWVSATMPVTGDVYSEDLGNPNPEKNMEWCYSWPMHFRAPTYDPTIYVRSSSDPFVLAAEMTGCTFNFNYKPPKRRINRWDIIIPLSVLGLSTLGLGGFCYFFARKPKVDYGPLLKDGLAPVFPGYGSATDDQRVGGASIEITELPKKHPKGA